MKINDIINEGYFVLPTMDRERYTDLSKEGLEGPFMTRSGKVVYYDPKEGKYYDRDSDMYLSHEEYEAYDSPQTNVNEGPGKQTIYSPNEPLPNFVDNDITRPTDATANRRRIAALQKQEEAIKARQLARQAEYNAKKNAWLEKNPSKKEISGKLMSDEDFERDDRRYAKHLRKPEKEAAAKKATPAAKPTTSAKKASLLRKINGVIKSSAKAAKNFGTGGKILGILGMLGSAGLELLDPSIKESINKVKQHILGESLGNRVTINEVQYILKAVQGFTVTLGNMEDPRQETQLNLADKKIDMTGAQGITITDELSPAERTNMLRRAKGAVVDVQVSNMR